MRRLLIISIIFLSSCASHKPRYVAKTGPVKAPVENKRQKTIIEMHLWALIMTGFIFHVLNEDSK